jgi:hypothetical protein
MNVLHFLNSSDVLTTMYEEYPDIWNMWSDACDDEMRAVELRNNGDIEQAEILYALSEEKKESTLVAFKIVFADHKQLS